jgi:hypothetical protein
VRAPLQIKASQPLTVSAPLRIKARKHVMVSYAWKKINGKGGCA